MPAWGVDIVNYSIFLGIVVWVSISAALPVEWDYSKAIQIAQQGDWQRAQQKMVPLLITEPERADLLYDMGVSSYKVREFQKAAAYFERAAMQSNAPVPLQTQAHFNLANSYVALEKLPEAIAEYEAVLAREPAHTMAAHNLKKIKERLRQQQRSQSKDQQNRQQQQQPNTQDKQQQASSADTQDNATNQEQEKKQHSSAPVPQQEKNQRNEKKEQQQSPGQKDASSDLTTRPEHQQERNQKNNQQGQEKKKSHQATDQNKSNEQSHNQPDNHTHSSAQSSAAVSKGNGTNHKMKEQKEQKGAVEEIEPGTKTIQPQFAPEEQWMAQILAEQEKIDQAAQKALIKGTVAKQRAGKHGQQGW
jgi:hypothetical protein